MREVRVLFTPADFEAFSKENRGDCVCVVFDVLRATTTAVAALAAGARGVVPVASVEEAVEWRRRDPGVVLAGERDGIRISAAVSGGVEFDLGNSPREFTEARVKDRIVVMTTTNGTRAIRACTSARAVFAGGLVNAKALALALRQYPECSWVLVCGGTYEDMAYEDVLGAGAVLSRLESEPQPCEGFGLDSAQLARDVYERARGDLMGFVGRFSRNGRRLLGHSELAGDVEWCLKEDSVPWVARLEEGCLRRWTPQASIGGSIGG